MNSNDLAKIVEIKSIALLFLQDAGATIKELDYWIDDDVEVIGKLSKEYNLNFEKAFRWYNRLGCRPSLITYIPGGSRWDWSIK